MRRSVAQESLAVILSLFSFMIVTQEQPKVEETSCSVQGAALEFSVFCSLPQSRHVKRCSPDPQVVFLTTFFVCQQKERLLLPLCGWHGNCFIEVMVWKVTGMSHIALDRFSSLNRMFLAEPLFFHELQTASLKSWCGK